MHRVLLVAVFAFFSASHLSLPVTFVAAQTRQSKGLVVHSYEPNVYAPQLYADKLKLKVILVNLPGSNSADSSWEAAYQLYFIPEAAYEAANQRVRKELAPDGGGFNWNPTASHFSEKTLLAQGSFKKKGLATPQDRIHATDNIIFKSKIPDKKRTKFARLLMSYSVKIYDGQLKLPLYRSSVWLTYPFNEQPAQANRFSPREVIFANFLVSPRGSLFASQLPRNNNDIVRWP